MLNDLFKYLHDSNKRVKEWIKVLRNSIDTCSNMTVFVEYLNKAHNINREDRWNTHLAIFTETNLRYLIEVKSMFIVTDHPQYTKEKTETFPLSLLD